MKKLLFTTVVFLSINLFGETLRDDIPAYTGEWGVAAIMFYHNAILKDEFYARRYLTKEEYITITNCLFLSIKEGFPIPTDTVGFVSLCLDSISKRPTSRVSYYIHYNTISHPRMIDLLTDARTNYFRIFYHLNGEIHGKRVILQDLV